LFSPVINLVSAQTEVSLEQKVATQSSKKEIGYTLPYPGMLPDNPLHFLKASRDKIISLLINTPIKKAEFNLLTSDKRMAAAKLLSDRNKDELSVSTLSKSNNYMHEAIAALRNAKKSDANYSTVLHNISLSVAKHKEILSSFSKSLDKKYSEQLKQEEKRLNEFEKSVNQILPK
jgi:hypothetical protein